METHKNHQAGQIADQVSNGGHAMMGHQGGGFMMDSTPLMTAVDVTIIALTIFAIWNFYTNRKMLSQLGVTSGVFLCLGGLFVISLFYMADLYTMFVLPHFMPMAEAMQIMNDLHLNYKWVVTVIAVGLIVIGIIYLIRVILPKISDLLEQNNSYQKDLEQKVKDRTASLNKALHDAKNANEVKNNFLSQMSHELRTPLNAVIGYSELLLEEKGEGSLSQEQQSDAKKILASGQHLLNLINDLLDLSKIELGNIDLDIQNIDIMDVYRDCSHIITPLSNSRNISINNQITDEKLYYVYADEQRLTQVFINFLTNAIKYNSKKGTVSLSCETPSKGRLRINITDTGKGIPKNLHHRVFNSFDRLGRNTEIDGSGIGLSLTKHLVEAMGGSVGFESEQGKGSTFWFELAAPVS